MKRKDIQKDKWYAWDGTDGEGGHLESFDRALVKKVPQKGKIKILSSDDVERKIDMPWYVTAKALSPLPEDTQ